MFIIRKQGQNKLNLSLIYLMKNFGSYLLKDYFNSLVNKKRLLLNSANSKLPLLNSPGLLCRDKTYSLRQRDQEVLNQHSLVVEEVIRLPVASLKFQYRSEWEPNPFYTHKYGRIDRSISSGPACRILEMYQRNGYWYVLKHLYETDYYRMYRWREEKGFYVNWINGQRVPIAFPDKVIAGKLLKLIQTYRSMERYEYLGPGFENRPIIAMERPYEERRFGHVTNIEPYEIWSGHNRASCLVALGYEVATVFIVRVEQ